MEMYVFKKSGFKNRQSEKLKDPNSRGAILIDAKLNNDGKIMLLHTQKDHTLLGTFLHILANLDFETETWEVRADEFKNWYRQTFDVNNRCDIEKRLNWLSSNGLIGFKQTSNKPQTRSKQTSNKPKVLPLEQAETGVGVISINNQPTNQHSSSEDVFENLFWKTYPKRQGKKIGRKECLDYWKSQKLAAIANEIHAGLTAWKATSSWQEDDGKYVPDPIRWLKRENWRDEVGPSKVTQITTGPTWAEQLLLNSHVQDIYTGEVIDIQGWEARGDSIGKGTRNLPARDFKPVEVADAG